MVTDDSWKLSLVPAVRSDSSELQWTLQLRTDSFCTFFHWSVLPSIQSRCAFITAVFDFAITYSQISDLSDLAKLQVWLFLHNGQNILSHQESTMKWRLICQAITESMNQTLQRTLINWLFLCASFFFLAWTLSLRQLCFHNYTDWHIQFNLHERGHFLSESLTCRVRWGCWGRGGRG